VIFPPLTVAIKGCEAVPSSFSDPSTRIDFWTPAKAGEATKSKINNSLSIDPLIVM
jgi:hypothetical protein